MLTPEQQQELAAFMAYWVYQPNGQEMISQVMSDYNISLADMTAAAQTVNPDITQDSMTSYLSAPQTATTTQTQQTTATEPAQTIQPQSMTFDDWMAQSGIRTIEGTDGIRYLGEDGRLSQNDLYRLYQQALTPSDLSGVILPDYRSPIMSRDSDAGTDWSDPSQDYLSDLRSLGYLPLSYFGDGNFQSADDWLQWAQSTPFQQDSSQYKVPFSGSVYDAYKMMYPQGTFVDDPTHGTLFQMGPYQNTGIDYYTGSPGMEFADYVLAGMMAVAGAEFLPQITGYGTPLSQWGAGAAVGAAEGSNIVMVDGVPIDLSSYMAGVDDFVAGAAGGATGASTGGDFTYNPGVFDENSPFIFDGETWYMPDGVTPLTPEGIASTVGTLQNGTFTPGTPNPADPTSPFLPPGATTPVSDFTPPIDQPNTVTTPGDNTNPGNLLDGFDWGSLLSSILSAYGNNQMADAYRDISEQYMGIGAPYRDLLLGSYQPGFSMQNEPGYADALKSSTDQFLRAASAGNAPGVGAGGNPFDNPNAWAETLKYVTSNTALPALYSYRTGLTSAGSLGLPQSIQPAMMSPIAQGQAYSNLGYGLSSLFPNQQQQPVNYTPPINQPNTFFV